MNNQRTFRCAVLSAVKHDYVARGLASHPRFELAVVADDPGVPEWAHERNQQFADLRGKRIDIGSPGSRQRASAEHVMAALGLTRNDFAEVRELPPAEQNRAFLRR